MSQHYGPQNYYQLGRIFPRDRIREPYYIPIRINIISWYVAPVILPIEPPIRVRGTRNNSSNTLMRNNQYDRSRDNSFEGARENSFEGRRE